MSTHRIVCFFLICLIIESSAHDKVSETGLETRSDEIERRDTNSEVIGAAILVAKEVSEKIHASLLTYIEIKIENLLSQKLTHFQGLVLSGKMEDPTMDILPQKNGSIKLRSGKVKFFTGTSGIVSWEIEGQNVLIIVMWRLNIFGKKQNALWIALAPVNSFDITDWQKYVVDDTEFPAGCSCKKGTFSSEKSMDELLTTLKSFKLQGMLGRGIHTIATIKLSLKK